MTTSIFNRNHLDIKLSDEQKKLITDAVMNVKICPWEANKAYSQDLNVPCPVCGSLGTGDNVYCLDDFRFRG